MSWWTYTSIVRVVSDTLYWLWRKMSWIWHFTWYIFTSTENSLVIMRLITSKRILSSQGTSEFWSAHNWNCHFQTHRILHRECLCHNNWGAIRLQIWYQFKKWSLICQDENIRPSDTGFTWQLDVRTIPH